MDLKRLERFPGPLVGLIGIGLVGGIGVLDYLTGSEISFSVFYLVPIALEAWFLGSRAGYGFSILSALVWYTADLLAGSRYSSDIIPIWNAGVRLSFFVILTIVLSRLKSILEREQHFARTDFLTGAHNKRSFEALLDSEIDRSRRYAHIFSVAYLDVDDFKRMNDGFGHASGDQLLKDVVPALNSAIRSSDAVGRIGGDEFAILLTENDPDQIKHAGTRLQKVLTDAARQKNWPVGFSLGMITYVSAPISSESALQIADQLMYQVKKGGKNSFRHEYWHEKGDA